MPAPQRTRPLRTFAQYRELSPDTIHTEKTYAAFQLKHHEVPAIALRNGPEAEFFASGKCLDGNLRGLKLRLLVATSNWVYAVPASYVQNFW